MDRSSTELHEPEKLLSPAVRDSHRALMSLIEELEAIDWYDQRAAACADSALRSIFEHNRDEEKEHAALLIEWLCAHDSTFDAEVRGRLFPPQASKDASLGVASLRESKA